MRYVFISLAFSILFIFAGDAINAQSGRYTAATPLATLEAECAKNDSEACLAAFLRYHEGRGVAADAKKAQFYMGRSCDTGVGVACLTYASVLENAPSANSQGGRVMVLRYADKACNLGEAEGCAKAKQLRAANATPAPKPAAKPATTVAVAPKPAATGNALLDECNAGRPDSCANYANVLGKQGDNAGALKYSQKACDMGEQAGCLNAKTYANRGAVTKPTPSSNAKLKADCDGGNRQACDGYAYTMSQAKNWPEAERYAEKSCQMGGKWGCDNRVQMKNAAARVGDQSEEGKQRARDWQIQNARQTGTYTIAITNQMKSDRDIATVSTLVVEAGPARLRNLDFAVLEDLAMNFPSSEYAAYSIIQNEWQRRGGPQVLAQREQKRKADQKAREEQQRQANMYQENRSSRNRQGDSSARSGTESCFVNGREGVRYWYYGFDNKRNDGVCMPK